MTRQKNTARIPVWKRHPYLVLKGLAIAASVTLVAGSWAQSNTSPIKGKLDAFVQQEVARKHSGGWSSVIVKLRKPLSEREFGQLRELNADITKRLDVISSLAVAIPTVNLPKLAGLRFIVRVSGDVKVLKNDEFTIDHSVAGSAFTQYGLTGKGVSVAVIDSGIGDSPDLYDPATGRSRVVAAVNFVPSSTSTNDLCGHGTHVAGIVAGNGSQSTGQYCFRTFFGMARKANLVSVRVLDATGATKVSTLVNALQWVIANRVRYNIRVINLSMGHSVGESYKTDPLCQAVEAAWKSGIVVVVAAGNEGRTSQLQLFHGDDNEGYGTAYGTIGSPGNDPYVITVGAMKAVDTYRAHDTVATYSSRGPSRLDQILKPDIMAPGNKVISLRRPLSYLDLTSLGNQVAVRDYNSRPGLLAQPVYFKLSGTSMATPVVAGAAALMLEASPGLTPDTVKARLMISADKWLDDAGNADACTYGAGYLNVAKALACTSSTTEYAVSPSLGVDDNGDVSLIVGDWANGNRALWGSNITDLTAVWGKRALWGSNNLAGNRALWGSSVWGDRAIWGNDNFSLGLISILLGGE